MALWFTFSYIPIWHMAWGGTLFAGGDEGNFLIAVLMRERSILQVARWSILTLVSLVW